MEQEFNFSTGKTVSTIDMQDILGDLKYNWMLALFVMSALLFIYVMFKNFVKFSPDSKYKWIEAEMDIMALTPAVFVLFICLSFFLKIKGW